MLSLGIGEFDIDSTAFEFSTTRALALFELSCSSTVVIADESISNFGILIFNASNGEALITGLKNRIIVIIVLWYGNGYSCAGLALDWFQLELMEAVSPVWRL